MLEPATPGGISSFHLTFVFTDAEYARLIAEDVEITTPIETEEWGERYFQITDPCGVVFQLVTWVDDAR